MPSVAVRTINKVEPNTNRFRHLADASPRELNPHQKALADFKNRQLQDRILSSRDDREWELGTRNGGKQVKPKGWAKREARLAESAEKTGKAVRLGVRHGPVDSPVSVEKGDDAAPVSGAVWRQEVNLVDLIQPGRVRKPRDYASEPVRRPETIPGLLTPSTINLDDYLSLDEIPAELLAELFPPEVPVTHFEDDSVSPGEESREDDEVEDGWEMAQMSEFSFDEVSVTGAG